LFINPWFEGAAAAFGLTENVPDVTGTWSVRGAIKDVSNWANAHGMDWMPGGDAPSNDFVQRVERNVYEAANAAIRGIGLPGKLFEAYDPTTSQIVNLRDRVEEIATEQWGPRDGWTDEQRQQVADGKVRAEVNTNGNPLSEQAWDDFTDMQMGRRAAGSVIPGGVRMVNADLTRRRDLATEFYDAKDAGGEVTPEMQAAADAMDTTNAGSPESLNLASEQQGYARVGTERQRAWSREWASVAYGQDWPSRTGVRVGGVFIPGYDLMAMPQEVRYELADRWVAEQGGTAELAEYRRQRDAYVAIHPEMQEYDTYADGVRKEGPRAFRTRVAKDHPEFADEQERRRRSLEGDGKRGELVEKELDEWATGAAAWNAFRGVRDSIYDEAPKDAYAPTADPYGGGQGGAPEGSWTGGQAASGDDRVTSLQEELTRYNAEMAIASNLLGTDATRLNPYTKKAYQNAYLVPVPSRQLELYLNWSAQQPRGADASVGAFVAYMDEIKMGVRPASGVPVRSNEPLRESPPLWMKDIPSGGSSSGGGYGQTATPRKVG
jgi:hypothetical protein